MAVKPIFEGYFFSDEEIIEHAKENKCDGWAIFYNGDLIGLGLPPGTNKEEYRAPIMGKVHLNPRMRKIYDTA